MHRRFAIAGLVLQKCGRVRTSRRWVYGLAIDPSAPATIYANLRKFGVLRSTDAGLTWRTENNGLPYEVLTLRLDPNDPSIIYAGTRGGGVYRGVITP